MWKRNRILGALMTLALGVSACDCSGAQLKTVRDTSVVINSPAGGDTVAKTASFDATATSAGGLQSLELRVGSKRLHICNAGADPSTIQCVAEVQVGRYLDQQVNNTLTFTASATDVNDAVVDASVTVELAPITIKFVRPNAQLPNVRGTSALALEVQSLLDVARVQVVADDKQTPFAQWLGSGGRQLSSGALEFKQDVSWASALGSVGSHKLKAQAKDINGQIASAELVVNVSCDGDADCADGQRCCATSGKCNPIVGPGADCDCDNPCPSDQGCFPGTCGRGKSKCRPGCYPGEWGGGKVGPTYYAERCSDVVPEQGQASRPAYCANLPPAQANEQNSGGACKPANQCDLAAQDCSDGLLNPDEDASPSNPVVPYTCSPEAPGVNVCIPAGSLKEGSENCSFDTCSSVVAGCAKGLMCVVSVDENGDPVDVPKCRRQCFNDEYKVNAFGYPDASTQEIVFGSKTSVCGRGNICVFSLRGPGLEPMGRGLCTELSLF
ncbi:MAG: hypothetical protein RL199_1592 [Pseudomonadota bacterium]|jgi:hypothetical protein